MTIYRSVVRMHCWQCVWTLSAIDWFWRWLVDWFWHDWLVL